MRALSGIEDIRHQHRVVGRAETNAPARQDQPVALDVVTDLEDTFVLENCLECSECVVFGDLPGAQLGCEQARGFALAGLAMAQRQVGRLVRRNRNRNPAKRRLHRIKTAGLRLESQHARFVGTRDPTLQLINRGDRLILCSVEFGIAQRLQPALRQRDRREHGRIGGRSCLAAARRGGVERQLALSGGTARRSGNSRFGR